MVVTVKTGDKLAANPHPPSCSICPLHEHSQGFALDRGDPQAAKIALILEAPGKDEIAINLRDAAPWPFMIEEAQREIKRREDAFPTIPRQFLTHGSALVGASWLVINNWILPKAGIQPYELFVSNVLRCLPPHGKDAERYPTGDVRAGAEAACRQYDRLAAFHPTVAVVTLHPASLLRDITPLSLVVEDFRKAAAFVRQGHRPMILCGGKAAAAFIRHGSNVTRFRGHFVYLPAWYNANYKKLFGAVHADKAEQAELFTPEEADATIPF